MSSSSNESKIMDEKSEERRKFLSDVAKVAFAGIIAAPVITSPFVEKSSSLLLQLGSTTQQNSDDTSQQTIQIAQIPNLPEAINGEDPIIRMMEDFASGSAKTHGTAPVGNGDRSPQMHGLPSLHYRMHSGKQASAWRSLPPSDNRDTWHISKCQQDIHASSLHAV